jgi:acyl carrier protein
MFGRLDGVFHLAGTTGSDSFRPIAELDDALCAAQFRPKVEGARVLAAALEGRRVDFVLLASSISTVLGGLGFGAYASANAFLESFAEAQSRSGSTPWVSVAWDGWSFRESERDAQAPSALSTTSGASTDRFALTPEEGVGVFDRVLALGRASRLVVSTCDLDARIDHLTSPVDRPPAAESAAATHARPALSTEYEAPGSDDERTIAAIWEDLLGVRPIGVHDNFFELGGHSLLAVQLVFRMTRELDAAASAHQLFEAPTIAKLARVIGEIRREQAVEADRIAEVMKEVAEMSDEEVERLLAQEGAS